MEEGRFDELGEGSDGEQESEVGNLTQLGPEKGEWAWFRGVWLRSLSLMVGQRL